MKILVFGGTGWLGHTIVKQLAAGGHEVVACSRGRKRDYPLPGTIRQLVVDKDEPEAVRELLAAERAGVVIDTRPSVKSVENFCRYGSGIRHYIHCSSTGGYAPLPFLPGDETAPYYRDHFPGGGWTEKFDVDTLVMDRFHRTGFPATVIRPCYITGEGMLPLDNLGGRRRDFLSDVKLEKILDLPENGLALLQPVEITDLASAFVLAAENARGIGEVYNVTGDHAFTLVRYLELTAGVFGVGVRLNFMSVEAMLAKYGEAIDEPGLRFLTHHMCYTNAKARRDLGFSPRHTPEEAVELTARWGARKTGI